MSGKVTEGGAASATAPGRARPEPEEEASDRGRRATLRRQATAHLLGMDAVRVLATVLVLVIHADHWPLRDGGADQAFWLGVDDLSRVSLPLFVILSGLLLAYRRHDEMALPAFFRRRLGRSLLPWFVWTPVYTVLGIVLTQEIPLTWPGVSSWWLLGGGHLWYLVLIPQLYLAFQLWPRSPRATAALALAAMALQTALCLYRLYAPASAPLNGLFLPHGFQFFFFWIGYFALGVALGSRLASDRLRWPAWPLWLAAAGGAALMLTVTASSAANASFARGTGAFLAPDLFLLVVPLFFAVAITAEPILESHAGLRELVRKLSRYSLGIYITHEALMYVPGRLLAPLLLQRHLPVSALGFPLLVPATLALAYVVTRLIVATPLAITVGLPQEPLRRYREAVSRR
jgi:surface polysaccharide O-acyltransferase-like enzyme